MAELTTTAETTTNSCCAPEVQATCCESSAKAECCDHDEGCGCAAGATDMHGPRIPCIHADLNRSPRFVTASQAAVGSHSGGRAAGTSG
jgi:hypothetical protein